MTVLEGQTSANFTVLTGSVTVDTNVTITASYLGDSKDAVLTAKNVP